MKHSGAKNMANTNKTNDTNLTPLESRLLMAQMESFARSEGYGSWAEYDAAMTQWGDKWYESATDEERKKALNDSYQK